MTVRGLTFGSAAERYERFRPGYCEALVDLVLGSLDVSTAIEIGAGTGKATRLFASRGLHVTAVEPDAAMRSVLVRTTAALPVTVEGCTLEDLPAREPVDLLYAAAAWHWTDPATRWPLAAALLREGGTFASFGSPVDLVDEELSAEIERLRDEVIERPRAR